jgi:RNA polymerase sigma-32 factor
MSPRVKRFGTRTGVIQRFPYLQKIERFPMLTAQQEYLLAKRWRDLGDKDAADRLATSHLLLVAKIAKGNRGYGLPLSELTSEGNIGLMQAIKRFDPDRGARLATYAIWWIKAAMHEYILRSWSLVKVGTTTNQRKLFFNLRRAKHRISALETGELRPDQAQLIARRLDVTEHEVIEMNRRLGGDVSLHSPIRGNASDEWQDWLIDDRANQEEEVAESDELDIRSHALNRALTALGERERRIFVARRLMDEPLTLNELATEFGVSNERVRQIEHRTFDIVQKAVRNELAGM